MQERRDIIPTIQPEKSDIQRSPIEVKLPAAAEPYHNYRGAAPEEGVRILDYWRAIRKRLWLVVGIAVLMTTLAAIYMSRRPDIFLAHARVQVDLEQVNPDLVSSERRAPVVNSDPAYFNTQLQLLNSPKLLRRVVKELDLENNKEFMKAKSEESRSSLRTLLRSIGLASPEKKRDSNAVPVSTSTQVETVEDMAEAKRLAPYVEELQRKLMIEPVREVRSSQKETRLIDIAYQHTNPELAAVIVNGVAATFVRSNQEKRTGKSEETNKYLQERVAELQAEVKRDQEQLVKLKQDSDILEFENQRTLAGEQTQLLNKQLLEVSNNRKEAEAKYLAARHPEALLALTEDSAARKFIDDIQLDIARTQREKERLLIEYTPEAPEVLEKEKEIETLNKKLDEFRKRNQNNLLLNLKTRFEQAKAQEEKIKGEFERQYNIAQTQNKAGIDITLLQQRLDNNIKLLDNLSNQQRENDIVAVGTGNNVSIADVAVTPEDPIGPRRLLTVTMAFMLSLVFGCGLALFLEYLDDTVRTTEDVENILRLPALAVIPTIDASQKRKLLAAGSPDNQNGTGRLELLISNDTRSALAEAYRQLRTSILLSTAGHAPKSLLVTSSVPSEGKTTTAVNTAISLAQTGAKVLIIDADMRRPRLHGIFQISNEHGLSSILSNQLDEDEILDIIQHDEESNLYLLPSGAVPPNPAELIGSDQMSRLLKVMEANFTHVVVDSPPIASFTDGVLISSMVDGVLLVVHSGKSSRQVIKRARQLLGEVGAKLFGVVLNNVNLRSQENHYYYQNYYYNSYYNRDED
ncbi:MAG: polysaccharide biosynthesis tyrosine autokinase [Acidobacteriota bacterium]|nr:polysaccharide biosynthesis tyrosine autokinase [Acidobacteriota bacterium]